MHIILTTNYGALQTQSINRNYKKIPVRTHQVMLCVQEFVRLYRFYGMNVYIHTDY